MVTDSSRKFMLEPRELERRSELEVDKYVGFADAEKDDGEKHAVGVCPPHRHRLVGDKLVQRLDPVDPVQGQQHTD